MVNRTGNSGSGNKILMGCGCVAAFLMIGIIGAGFYLVPKVVESAQDAMSDMAFAQNWSPPASDISAEELFPEMIGDFKRSNVGGESIVDIMGFKSADGFADYQSADEEVRVFMKQVDFSEKETIFDGVSTAIDNGNFALRSTATIGDSMTFSVSSPREVGKLWWSKGWMFFFYKTSSGDAGDFADEFLTDVQSK